jgi:8-amino-3,8-dideoxy-alpha-D-manno-octulosonate transaminase
MSSSRVSDGILQPNWPGAFMMDDAEVENVLKVARARSPFRYYGEDMQYFALQLEEAFMKRLDRKYALAVNSGTGALSVAVNALGIGPGDEVLIPGFLYVACIGAIIRAGAIPRLVEVDESLCMDPDDLERKITPHSKAVMIIQMAGTTGRLDELLAVARKHNLLVLEDVAQAAGASYRGKPLGSFGDISIFSFQLNKNITCGEGGLVTCDDYVLSQRAYAAHDHGYPRDKNGKVYSYIEHEEAMQTFWGEGRRMSELCAAMMVAQEQKLDGIVGRMRRASQRLYDGLQEVAGAQIRARVDPSGDSGNNVILIWPTAEICREMVEATRAEGVRDRYFGGGNNILNQWHVHVYYGNRNLVERRPINHTGRPWSDPFNAFAQDYSYDRGTLPRTDALFDRSSSLGVSPAMDDALCDRIIEIFHQSARRLGLA